ncbi:MAG: TOBE domain-containing protein, partial [Pseudomonadota bacterium]|nr:TOBE domain-containing protein [Pseudomonadota bacterium]
VVLNRGHVEQVGSPHELYQRPATKFVAGFIGSPTMNFMPAELLSGTADGCRVKAAGVGEVSLPQAGDAYSKGTSLTLGVRPEHLRLEAPQGDNCFDIVNVEYLGNEVYVYLEPKEGSTLLIHRSEAPSQWQEGQQVSLVPDTEHVHLFDESGAALILSATRTAA